MYYSYCDALSGSAGHSNKSWAMTCYVTCAEPNDSTDGVTGTCTLPWNARSRTWCSTEWPPHCHICAWGLPQEVDLLGVFNLRITFLFQWMPKNLPCILVQSSLPKQEIIFLGPNVYRMLSGCHITLNFRVTKAAVWKGKAFLITLSYPLSSCYELGLTLEEVAKYNYKRCGTVKYLL